jgi:ABC-type cobalt transport system substrate-binding protein
MNRITTLVLLLALSVLPVRSAGAAEQWEGVDKTVIEKVAEQAGRPPREPYLNTDRGDLLLCLFLLAGAIGGFIAGYTFRGLFPPGQAGDRQHASTP